MRDTELFRFACLHCRQQKLVCRTATNPEMDQVCGDGEIDCDNCGAKFPIVAGVPRFVVGEQYTGSFGFQWNRFRKTQLDSHTGLSLSRDRFFRVTGWPIDLKGQLVLEAGSGAGRFTEVLAGTGATVLSFDLSSAVVANFANHESNHNVTIFQASIYDLPFPETSFDKVLCLGVLQHTPDPEKSFECLARMVKPGGELAVDIYSKSPSAVLSWKYLLRPITVRMRRERLFKWVVRAVDLFLPAAIYLRRFGGRVGARLLPILQYSHWGLPDDLNRQWAILDTFDMYSPAHDHPRSAGQVRRWFEAAGFEQIDVGPGPNGVTGRGRKLGTTVMTS